MLTPFQHRVARVVGDALGQFGFALGGGQALQAHQIVDRMSKDLDNYTTSKALHRPPTRRRIRIPLEGGRRFPPGPERPGFQRHNPMKTDDIDRLARKARESADKIETARRLMAHHARQRRDAVVSLRALGLSYGRIASELGCSRSAIQSILRDDRCPVATTSPEVRMGSNHDVGIGIVELLLYITLAVAFAFVGLFLWAGR